MRSLRQVDTIHRGHLLTVMYEDLPAEHSAGASGGVEVLRVEHCCGCRRRELAYLDEAPERALLAACYDAAQADADEYWRAKIEDEETREDEWNA